MARAVAVDQHILVAGHDDLAEAERPAGNQILIDIEVDERADLGPDPRVVMKSQIEIDPASVELDERSVELKIAGAHAGAERPPGDFAPFQAGLSRSPDVGAVPGRSVRVLESRHDRER